MTDPASEADRDTSGGSAAPAAPAAPADPAFEDSHAAVRVIEDRDEYLRAVAAIAAGHGPVAVDAERASGYRYSQRAYLIQVFRRGAGAFLFDPIAIGDFTELQDAIVDEEWLFHAASQDLPCLQEVGLVPTRIFDTELGARIAGFPRVGLGAVVEQLLGITLAKAHSAADWSTRPLPQSWLVYAALDVELLPDLRDALAAALDAAGKSRIAEEEFAAVLTRAPKPPRAEPWRRLSGMHALRVPERWRSPAPCGPPATSTPVRPTSPPVGPSRTPRSSPRRPPPRHEGRTRCAQGLHGSGQPVGARPLVGRRRRGPHDRGPAEAPRLGRGHAAPAPGVGRPQPRGRPPLQGRPRRGRRARRGARPARREPPHAGDAPPGVVGAADADRDRDRRCRARVPRRPPVAGRGDGLAHRARLCRCWTGPAAESNTGS